MQHTGIRQVLPYLFLLRETFSIGLGSSDPGLRFVCVVTLHQLYVTVLGFWYWWGKSRVSLFFNISCLQHNKTVTIKSHRSIMKSREWWRWYKTLQARTYLPYSTFNTKDAQERHTTSQTTPHAHTHTHTHQLLSLLPTGTCLCKQQDLKTVSQACHTHVV